MMYLKYWGAAAVVMMVTAALGAQTITTINATRLNDAKGNLFLRVSGDGSKVLVNSSPTREAEELAIISRTSGAEQIWHRKVGPAIFNEIAVNQDGTMVAFADCRGSEVFVLTTPGGPPRSIANVQPDGDIRQLMLSSDGKWAAFTASNFMHDGKLGRNQGNLYVAATDGTSLVKITAKAIHDKLIPFTVSADSKSIVWVPDPTAGPWIADIDGKNAKELPAPGEPRVIQAVHCNTTASTIYYETSGSGGLKLQKVQRGGSQLSLVHEAVHGFYQVSNDATKIYLCQIDQPQLKKGSWSEWNGAALVPRVILTMPRPLGTFDWSPDCRVMVWRDMAGPGQGATFAWEAGQ